MEMVIGYLCRTEEEDEDEDEDDDDDNKKCKLSYITNTRKL
jgi:hypothetical protein